MPVPVAVIMIVVVLVVAVVTHRPTQLAIVAPRQDGHAPAAAKCEIVDASR